MYSFGFLVLWKEKMRRKRSARWLRREVSESVDLMMSSSLPPPSSSVAVVVVVDSLVSPVVDILFWA